MDLLIAALALALPMLLGMLCLQRIVPAGLPGRVALVAGNGGLLGLLFLPQLMRLFAAAGLGLHLVGLTVALILLALLVTRLPQSARHNPSHPGQPAASGLAQALFALFFALIAVRTVSLGLELLWRPLFPWDATMQWATKARVWFEHADLVPFVDHDTWLALGGAGVYTDRHPYYPATVPLLQTWICLALGDWNESLMNLPWLACYAALGLAFYGHLRLAGAGPVVAVAFTYLLLSMPLLNIHVALAGYADLFLAAAFGCAAMALHNWVRTRQAWLAGLCLLFALLCTQIKNEGVIWVLTLAPAAALVYFSRGAVVKLSLLVAAVAVVTWLAVPADSVIVGHRLSDFTPAFNRPALSGLIYSVWIHDSWHLLGYLLLLALPWAALTAAGRDYRALALALGCALAAFAFLFLFTGFGSGAVNFASVGRLELQLAPALLFLAALVARRYLQDEPSPQATRGPQSG